MATGTLVRVRSRHIRTGLSGNCFNCAVALAVQEATGDDSANVWADWGIVRVEVGGRSIIPARRVTDFIHAYDDAGDRDKPPELPARLWGTPFDPEWEEKCVNCEELRNPRELSDEGVCEECQRERITD